MDWLEQELKVALERKAPSAGFAERVRAAARAPQRRWWKPRPWMAAAAMLLVAFGSFEYREYRGRQAKQRVLLALRITAVKLHYIQQHARGSSEVHQ